MRIMIAAAGSRGDVAPYTGLGAELSRAGHDVALAATDTFAPLAHEAGLEFRGLPAGTRGHGDVTGKRDLMRAAAAFITELGQGFADAVDKGTDLLLLSTTTAPLGRHPGRATGTPNLGMYLPPPRPAGTSSGCSRPAWYSGPGARPRRGSGGVTGAVTARRAPDGARDRRDAGAARSRRPYTTAGPTRPAPGTGTRAGAPGSTPPCAVR